ncbi:hypothetical protein VTN77DRAFT_686 [Rasamsonia byssochlamydoides]|uniref:uncharacterized protein n=1 Tax=Rasamsonia byssochlamydoides TaxID=89139 RepID=UPI00374400A0
MAAISRILCLVCLVAAAVASPTRTLPRDAETYALDPVANWEAEIPAAAADAAIEPSPQADLRRRQA